MPSQILIWQILDLGYRDDYGELFQVLIFNKIKLKSSGVENIIMCAHANLSGL